MTIPPKARRGRCCGRYPSTGHPAHATRQLRAAPCSSSPTSPHGGHERAGQMPPTARPITGAAPIDEGPTRSRPAHHESTAQCPLRRRLYHRPCRVERRFGRRGSTHHPVAGQPVGIIDVRDDLETEALIDRRVDRVGGLKPGRGAVLVAPMQLPLQQRPSEPLAAVLRHRREQLQAPADASRRRATAPRRLRASPIPPERSLSSTRAMCGRAPVIDARLPSNSSTTRTGPRIESFATPGGYHSAIAASSPSTRAACTVP
jgi:hypothetical protein